MTVVALVKEKNTKNVDNRALKVQRYDSSSPKTMSSSYFLFPPLLGPKETRYLRVSCESSASSSTSLPSLRIPEKDRSLIKRNVMSTSKSSSYLVLPPVSSRSVSPLLVRCCEFVMKLFLFHSKIIRDTRCWNLSLSRLSSLYFGLSHSRLQHSLSFSNFANRFCFFNIERFMIPSA
jgi:hypothetical protein